MTGTAARPRLCPVRARIRHRFPDGERGSAVVEFLGAALLLLVPLVYLVLLLGQVQAATFAAEAAAREAGRIVARASDLTTAQRQAATAVDLAFADQGIDVDAALHITCTTDPCLSPGGSARVVVRADVDLPLVPAFAAGTAQVGVEASHLAVVDRFRERP